MIKYIKPSLSSNTPTPVIHHAPPNSQCPHAKRMLHYVHLTQTDLAPTLEPFSPGGHPAPSTPNTQALNKTVRRAARRTPVDQN
jgi:hypothetical protein